MSLEGCRNDTKRGIAQRMTGTCAECGQVCRATARCCRACARRAEERRFAALQARRARG